MYPNQNSSKYRPPSPTTFVNFSPPTDYPISSSISSNGAGGSGIGGGINGSISQKSSIQNNHQFNESNVKIATKPQKPTTLQQQKFSTNNMAGIHNYNASESLQQQQQQQHQQLLEQEMLSHHLLTLSSKKQKLLQQQQQLQQQQHQQMQHLSKTKLNHNNNSIIAPGGFIVDNHQRIVQSATMGGRTGEFYYHDDIDIDSIELINSCRQASTAANDNLLFNKTNNGGGGGVNSSRNTDHDIINSKTLGGLLGNYLSNGGSFTERRRRGHSRRSNHKMEVEQQVKWTRKNIAATMERFEPTQSKTDYGSTSITPPLQNHSHEHNNPMNHVYSYAYYEPGMPKCHTNIPNIKEYQQHHQLVTSSNASNQISTTSIASTSSSSSSVGFSVGAGSGGSNVSSPFPVNMGASTSSGVRQAIPGPSKSPPRNSIRALLAKSFRKTLRHKSLDGSNPNHSPTHSGDERHSYTTRYGTTENLYEEVGDGQKIRKVLSDNRIVTINSPTVTEEFRRVQHNHFRVLDELNLSLEALIMPPTPPDVSPTVEEKVSHASSMENLSSTLNSIELKDHTCVNPEFDEGDLDSGFSGSGSSSGASYNESLRYYKTNGSNIHQTITGNNIKSNLRNSTASGTSTSKSSMNSEDQGIGLMEKNGSLSPFNFIRRCSDSQRSSSSMSAGAQSGSTGGSATPLKGIKLKKSFWPLKH